MQLPKVAGWLRAGACSGLVCAIAAALVSFAWPDQYVSSALLRFRPRYVPEQELGMRQEQVLLRLNALQQDSLSRTSLVQIISNIDLYARERRSSPLEDVIETMRIKDVRLQLVDSPGAFRISFEYPDARLAQRVVRALVIALIDANERLNLNPSKMDGEPLSPEILEIVDEASLPERSAGPNRYAIAGIGLCAGFVLGLAGFAMRRVSWRQALRIAAAALSGFAVAGGVTFLFPDDKFADLLARLPFAELGAAAGLLVWAVVRGERAAWRRPHYLWSALAGGALGAIAAGMVAYAIPPRYESTAVLKIDAATKTGTPVEDVNERYAEIRDEVLSRSDLEELVQRPSLDLYPSERKRHSMEEVISNMRANDLRIKNGFGTSSSPRPVSAVFISLDYPDRFKAQAVVREIAARFIEESVTIDRRRNQGEISAGTGVMGPGSLAEALLFKGNVVIDRRRNQGETHAGTIVMEVLDPASLPEEPVFPQSPATMAAAAGAGALLALVLAFLRRRPPGQAAAMLKLGAAGAAAGALLAGAIAFAIPSRYVSTAVLRIRPGIGGKVSTRHVVDYAVQETTVILSRSNLAELMQRSDLDLYHGERARHPMEQVIDQMREDLRIEPPAPAGLRTTFSIAFTYTDRFKAQAVVREVESRFMDSQTNYLEGTPGLELDSTDEARLQELDPASLPEAPVWPPRGGIITGGLLAGLLLGLAAAVIRRGPGRSGVDTTVSDPACANSDIDLLAVASTLENRHTERDIGGGEGESAPGDV